MNKKNCKIRTRVSTGTKGAWHLQNLWTHCKPLQGKTCNENMVFPANFSLQGKTCFHYREGLQCSNDWHLRILLHNVVCSSLNFEDLLVIGMSNQALKITIEFVLLF